MSHYFKSGFSVRQPMWHGLGTIIDKVPESVDEVLELTFAPDPVWEPEYSGVLTTTVARRCQSKKDECRNPATYAVTLPHATEPHVVYACKPHAMRADGRTINDASGVEYKVHIAPLDTTTEEGWQCIKRSDNGHTLHISKTSFEVFGNREAAELLVEVLQGVNEGNGDSLPVNWETGIQLKEGGLIVFCASIDTPYEIAGGGITDPNPIFPFSSIHNYHDGSGALRCVNTSIRPVCWNTTNAAEHQAGKSGRAYTFKHTKNMRDAIEKAKEALFSSRTETEEWVEHASKLIAIPVSDQQLDSFLVDFVPDPPVATDRVMRNVRNARSAIRSYYHSPTTAAVAGTAWGVVCATVEYLDHGRTFRTPETYVGRTLLKPEQGKTKALELLADTVGYDVRTTERISA